GVQSTASTLPPGPPSALFNVLGQKQRDAIRERLRPFVCILLSPALLGALLDPELVLMTIEFPSGASTRRSELRRSPCLCRLSFCCSPAPFLGSYSNVRTGPAVHPWAALTASNSKTPDY